MPCTGVRASTAGTIWAFWEGGVGWALARTYSILLYSFTPLSWLHSRHLMSYCLPRRCGHKTTQAGPRGASSPSVRLGAAYLASLACN